MMIAFSAYCRRHAFGVAFALGVACAAAPLAAQGLQTIDPDSAIDGDLAGPQPAAQPPAAAEPQIDYDSDLAPPVPPTAEAATTPAAPIAETAAPSTQA